MRKIDKRPSVSPLYVWICLLLFILSSCGSPIIGQTGNNGNSVSNNVVGGQNNVVKNTNRGNQNNGGGASATPSPTPMPSPSVGASVKKVIGPSGGVVELAGVGKLEIPAGALNAPTEITMSKLLNVEYPTSEPNSKSNFEFVSPVVKLEPSGLVLLKPAILNLPTDMQRVGKNHPSIIDWVTTDNDKDWTLLKYAPGVPHIYQWKSYTYPSQITVFKTVAKRFPREISSTASFQLYIAPNTFTTQQIIGPASSFEFYFDTSISTSLPSVTSKIAVVKQAADIADNYYRTLMSQIGASAFPKLWKQDLAITPRLFIPVYLSYNPNPSFPDRGGLTVHESENSSISIYDFGNRNHHSLVETMAHELWHVFQYAYFNNKLQTIIIDQWLIEGPATHMAASVIAKYAFSLMPATEQKSIPDYDARLIDNQSDYLGKSLNKLQNNPSFFSYLAHYDTQANKSTTDLGEDKIIAHLAELIGKNYPTYLNYGSTLEQLVNLGCLLYSQNKLACPTRTLQWHHRRYAYHAFTTQRYFGQAEGFTTTIPKPKHDLDSSQNTFLETNSWTNRTNPELFLSTPFHPFSSKYFEFVDILQPGQIAIRQNLSIEFYNLASSSNPELYGYLITYDDNDKEKEIYVILPNIENLIPDFHMPNFKKKFVVILSRGPSSNLDPTYIRISAKDYHPTSLPNQTDVPWCPYQDTLLGVSLCL